MQQFMDAAANWGERRDVPVVFVRDAGEWFARIDFEDANGRYHRLVRPTAPKPFQKAKPATKKRKGTPAKPAEGLDEYQDRIDGVMRDASIKAHQSRQAMRPRYLSDDQIRQIKLHPLGLT